DFPFAVGADGTKLLRANEEILDAEFFYLALLNLNVPNKGYNRHFKFLREFSISFPESKAEQRSIARALRTVQEAREARRKELKHLDELFRAMLEELMTGRLSATALIEVQ